MTTEEKTCLAQSLHREGFSCAQAVAAALQELTGLDRDTLLAAAGGFGGGMGAGEVCGALSGAVMAIGLAVPHTVGADQRRKAYVRSLTEQCVSRFRDRFGYSTCRELVERFQLERCQEFITFCTALGEEIIQKAKEEEHHDAV